MLKRYLLAFALAAPLAAFAQAGTKPADTKPAAPAAKPAAAAPAADAAKPANQSVILHTSLGDITIELFADKAPKSVENFLQYAKDGFYDGTVFHRVIDNFMIQGGGFTKDMQEKPTQAPIKNEGTNGLTNDMYTIAMARRPDPNSATAQFFINTNDNAALNGSDMKPGYAVFGKVTSGQQTVEKIKKVATGNKNGHQNVPNEPVVIEKAECV